MERMVFGLVAEQQERYQQQQGKETLPLFGMKMVFIWEVTLMGKGYR